MAAPEVLLPAPRGEAGSLSNKADAHLNEDVEVNIGLSLGLECGRV